MRRHHRGIIGHPIGKALACYLVAATALLGAPSLGRAALAPTPLAAGEPGAGRAEDLARLQRVLEEKRVAERLAELGFSAEEIRARLEALDDERLHEVAERLDGLVAAGYAPLIVVGTLFLYVAALAVVGVGWVIYKLVAAIARSSSAPETAKGEVAPPKEEGEVWQAPGTPTGPAGDPLPQDGKDAPQEASDCGGYRERPGGGNPGIPFNPAAPPPPC